MAINRSVERATGQRCRSPACPRRGRRLRAPSSPCGTARGFRTARRPRSRRRRPSAVQPPWPLSGPDRAGACTGVRQGSTRRIGCSRAAKRSSASGSTSSGSPRPSARCRARRQPPRPNRACRRRAMRSRRSANSERKGCALGAATALVGDWWPIRRLLDRAATRAGLECPAPRFPTKPRWSGSSAAPRTLRRAIARLLSAASSFCSSIAPCSTCSRPGRRHGATIRFFFAESPSRQSYPQDFWAREKKRWTNQLQALSIKTCSGTSVPEHGNPAGSNRRGLRYLGLRNLPVRLPAAPFPHSQHRLPG